MLSLRSLLCTEGNKSQIRATLQLQVRAGPLSASACLLGAKLRRSRVGRAVASKDCNNIDLEMNWMEAAVALFQVLSRYLSADAECNNEDPQLSAYNRYTDRDSRLSLSAPPGRCRFLDAASSVRMCGRFPPVLLCPHGVNHRHKRDFTFSL